MAGDPGEQRGVQPAGSLLAVGNQTLQLWNPVTRLPVATAPPPAGTFVNAVAFAPSGQMVAAGYGNGMAQLRGRPAPRSGRRCERRGRAVESVTFNPSGQVMATAPTTGRCGCGRCPAPPSARWPSCTTPAPTCTRWRSAPLAGCWPRRARTTRPGCGRSPTRPGRRRRAPLTGPTSYAISVAFGPAGRLLAVGSADKTVRLWSVADPSRPVPLGRPLAGPTSYVDSVTFSPDGKTLAAGVTDGTVWMWDLAVPAHPSLMATINGPNGHVYSVAFSPSGRVVAAGSADGTVRLWDTSPAAAAAAVCVTRASRSPGWSGPTTYRAWPTGPHAHDACPRLSGLWPDCPFAAAGPVGFGILGR